MNTDCSETIKDRELGFQIEFIIPVTRRVKGYTIFIGKYVTGRKKAFPTP